MRAEEATRSARSGEDEADVFAALYDRYAPRIHAFMFHMTGDADEAAALTQETFLRAFRSPDRPALCHDASGGTNAWLHRLAADACLASGRHRRGRGRWGMRWPWAAATGRVAAPPRGLLALGGSPLAQRALRRLPPRARLALLLRDHVGLAYAEIGAALGLSHAATRGLVYRAREEYRALRGRTGEGL